MTNSQAHQFVGRWRRILIPWPSPHTDTGAARAMERAFLGIAVGPLLPYFVSAGSGFVWPARVVIPLSIVLLASCWLGWRFRAARRLLEEADAQHMSDLRKPLVDRPSA